MEDTGDSPPIEEVSDAELDENTNTVDSWFDRKDDESLSNRITNSIEKLRRWVSENGRKKEPVLPPGVEKLTPDVSLADENLYYRYSDGGLNSFMFWAVDIENDPESYEATNGIVLRIIKDDEVKLTIIDVHYPHEKRNLVEIGTTIIRSGFPSGEQQTVNFPPRRLSRLSGSELQNADVYLRCALESTQASGGAPNVSPVLRRLA